MWMFKPFSGKEQTGLEGRFIEIGNEKLRVQNIIAEGGFSCVYLAHDSVNASKQYALKHMICQDEDSLDLVMKEIQVMKLLKGHPNVVTLVAHSILDMGRRKEVLLMMEFCEKSLFNVLESRGTRYFDEKQALSIFRDVCNAVFAMHSLSPPIAHRWRRGIRQRWGFWKRRSFTTRGVATYSIAERQRTISSRRRIVNGRSGRMAMEAVEE